MNVFAISIPLFLIIFSGWVLKKYGIIKESWISALNGFVYWMALPAAVISYFWDINFSDSTINQTLIWSLSISLLFMLVVFILVQIFIKERRTRAAIFLTAVTGNTIYMGMPIVASGLGEGGVSFGAISGVIFLVLPILSSAFVIRLWCGNDHSIKSQLISFLGNPLFISVVAGVIVGMFIKEASSFLTLKKAVIMLGATASPVALVDLGAFLYGRFFKRNISLIGIVTFLKIIAFPAVVLLIYFSTGQTDFFKAISIMSVMPVAVTTFVLSEKYKLDSELVGNSILASTVLAFIAIPIVLAIVIK